MHARFNLGNPVLKLYLSTYNFLGWLGTVEQTSDIRKNAGRPFMYVAISITLAYGLVFRIVLYNAGQK
jgi:hypothetical protein